MKPYLLAGTAFLALAASGSAAHAQRVNFTYTGSLVTFTVPKNGTYQILAFGAQGGNGIWVPTGVFGAGGRGAEIGGDFILTGGEMLQIAVGGAGSNNSFGGGGGGGSLWSAQVICRWSLLVAAAGAALREGPALPARVASPAPTAAAEMAAPEATVAAPNPAF